MCAPHEKKKRKGGTVLVPYIRQGDAESIGGGAWREPGNYAAVGINMGVYLCVLR